MIQPKLTEVLAEKSKSLYWLAQQTEIAYSTLFKFAKAKTQSVDYRVLDRICEALDCEPGDLLRRTKEAGAKKAKGK